MNKKTIWNRKQNKPSLIVGDLAAYIPSNIIYESLLGRGVFKWFSARRKIIKLKEKWKKKIIDSYQKQTEAKFHKVWYWRGYRKALTECRAEVRQICHGERWEAPDIDRKANLWLRERSK